jgi:hypothetical protein
VCSNSAQKKVLYVYILVGSIHIVNCIIFYVPVLDKKVWRYQRDNRDSLVKHRHFCRVKEESQYNGHPGWLNELGTFVVGLLNNSYKLITNTACARARLCKLQKRCTRLTAASRKVYQLLAHGQGALLVMRYTFCAHISYETRSGMMT